MFPLIAKIMKEYFFCNQSNNFLIRQNSIFVIFISRDYISKQVYRLKKGLDLKRKWDLFKYYYSFIVCCWHTYIHII